MNGEHIKETVKQKYGQAALREHGISWAGHAPRSVDGLEREHWDFVVTVCNRAKEACPIFPGAADSGPLGHARPRGGRG